MESQNLTLPIKKIQKKRCFCTIIFFCIFSGPTFSSNETKIMHYKNFEIIDEIGGTHKNISQITYICKKNDENCPPIKSEIIEDFTSSVYGKELDIPAEKGKIKLATDAAKFISDFLSYSNKDVGIAINYLKRSPDFAGNERFLNDFETGYKSKSCSFDEALNKIGSKYTHEIFYGFGCLTNIESKKIIKK